jgi:hypothetical protein
MHRNPLPMPEPDQKFTPAQAAEYLGLSPRTLSNMRSSGDGPTFYKIGGVFYKKADLDAWIETRRVEAKTNAK